jgi:hypothetical protein
MRTLMTIDARGLCDPAKNGPLSGHESWIAAFEKAGQALARLNRHGQLERGLRAVLAHHLIFHFNRAGLGGADQSTMAALAVEVVFHSPEPSKRQRGCLRPGSRAPTITIDDQRCRYACRRRVFWATIEQLAPDQPDLRIDGELYQRWRDQIAVRADGKGRRDIDGSRNAWTTAPASGSRC